ARRAPTMRRTSPTKASRSSASPGCRAPTPDAAPGSVERENHVVDVEVGGESPAIRQRIVAEAGDLGGAQPIAAQRGGEFRRADEFAPFVGAARQPAEHVFGADDGEQIGFGRSVER